jgi:hypothetical protein
MEGNDVGGEVRMSQTVRIPSDIDQEDKILAGLTARQLVILVMPAVFLWATYLLTRTFVPLLVFCPIAVIVAGAAGTLVVTKRDGLSMDRFAMAAFRHQRSPKKFVPVGDNLVALPSSVAALSLPLVGIGVDGVLDLGANGAAILLEARAVDLSLQSDSEQQATTAAFGRFCNSLGGAMQIVAHSEPVDLLEAADQLDERALSLPAIGLETAAQDHAAFLRSLSRRHDVLRRRVLVVLRDARSVDVAGPFLHRRADEAIATLRVAGIELTLLSGAEAALVIQRSCAPSGPIHPLTDDIVRGA